MPPIVATKFPTHVSIVAAPVAKGLFIKTNIEAGYHEQGTITLRQRPELVHLLYHLLYHMTNGLPYTAFIDDELVRKRSLRMISHFFFVPYSNDKATKMLSTQ
jgi:hypothetical protein